MNAALQEAGGETVADEEEAGEDRPLSRDESTTRNYEVSKEVSVRRKSPGAVERASIAVVIREGDTALTKTELAEVEALVRGAVGLDEERGDQLIVRGQAFAGAPVLEELPLWEQAWVQQWAGKAVLLLLGIAALLFVGRPLRSLTKKGAAAEANAAGPAEEGEEERLHVPEAGAEHARSAAAAAPAPAETGAPGSSDFDTRVQLLREIVATDARRASSVVSELMRTQKTETAHAD